MTERLSVVVLTSTVVTMAVLGVIRFPAMVYGEPDVAAAPVAEKASPEDRLPVMVITSSEGSPAAVGANPPNALEDAAAQLSNRLESRAAASEAVTHSEVAATTSVRPPASFVPTGAPFLGVRHDRRYASAVVGHVQRESPAAEAGLQVGDEILQVDGTSVASFATVRDAIAKLEPGMEVGMVIRRGDEVVSLLVAIGRK